MDERARVAHLARVFAWPGGAPPGVELGIGDDAAVLAVGGERLVWTVDAQVDGTHFRTDWVSWEDVGYRSFMAAASDLAAMGASPFVALSSLVLGAAVDDDAFDAIARGQADAARVLGLPVVGGNLARGTETSITTTVLGRADAPVTRSGARAGDAVFVAGALGLAAAGLRLLVAGHAETTATAPCFAAWRRPRARLDDGLALRGRATAAADVSDGLARDLGHVCEASHVSAVLDERALRATFSPALCAAAAALGVDPLGLALEGGEDYALVATGPSAPTGFQRIGTVEARAAERLRLLRDDGTIEALREEGFDHFRRR